MQKLDSSWSLIEGDGLDILESQEDILEGAEEIVDDQTTEEDDEEDYGTASTKRIGSDLLSDEDEEYEDNNTFKVLARDLTEKGLASFDDDWDGDEDDFRNNIIETAKGTIMSQYNLNNPIVKNFLEYVSAGGAPQNFIQSVTGPSFEDADDKEVYKAYLKATTKFSDSKIEKLADRVEMLEELEEEAESAREWFNQNQSEQAEQLAQQQAQEAEMRKRAEAQDMAERRRLVTTSKNIGGVPIENAKGFEKFYFEPTETFKHEDSVYKVTPYQKRLLEKNSDERAKREYELLLAYLEFSNYTIKDIQRQSRQAATSSLKQSLEKTIRPNTIKKLIN